MLHGVTVYSQFVTVPYIILPGDRGKVCEHFAQGTCDLQLQV